MLPLNHQPLKPLSQKHEQWTQKDIHFKLDLNVNVEDNLHGIGLHRNPFPYSQVEHVPIGRTMRPAKEQGRIQDPLTWLGRATASNL